MKLRPAAHTEPAPSGQPRPNQWHPAQKSAAGITAFLMAAPWVAIAPRLVPSGETCVSPSVTSAPYRLPYGGTVEMGVPVTVMNVPGRVGSGVVVERHVAAPDGKTGEAHDSRTLSSRAAIGFVATTSGIDWGMPADSTMRLSIHFVAPSDTPAACNTTPVVEFDNTPVPVTELQQRGVISGRDDVVQWEPILRDNP